MTASDLSLGGLYCSSTRDYPEMTRLAVRLRLPSDAPIDVEAVVVRRERRASVTGEGRYELALFFTGMSDGARETLARFLAQRVSTT
jgi:PilZ domain-containing protein